MIRSSVVFSSLTMVSRLMGLARDLVLTAVLGASQTVAADAYATAAAFPNLFRRIFAEGAFASAFVPGYSRKLAADGPEAADRYAADAVATVAAATVALTLVLQLAMPWLMYAINPGYVDEPEKFRLAVILTQITMPYLPCMAIAAAFSGVLNARGRFIISAAYPTVLNAVMLLALLPLRDPTRAAYVASVATIVAGIGQAGLCWWGAKRTGAHIRLARPKLTPEVKALIRLAIPTGVANSATQVNIFISGILASQVSGARVWLSVADRLYQLPMGMVGVAIGVALLPRLAQALQKGDHDDAQASMDQAIVFALAFSLPAAAALMAMPFYLIDGLFTRGAFVTADARATADVLFHYGWGVPAFVLLSILRPAFFARRDATTPMRFALISVAVNIVMGVALFFLIGVPGIAAATSFAAWINVAQMAANLWRRDTWRPTPLTVSRGVRITAASLGMGLLLAIASHFRERLEAPFALLAGHSLGAKEIVLLGVCAAGAAGYVVLLFAFGGVKPAEVRAALKRRPTDPIVPPTDLPGGA